MNKLVKYIIESRYNFNIDQLDLKDNEQEFSLSKQKYKSKSMKQEYIENNQFVDLGLPSGTLWRRYNLGANLKKLNKAKSWIGYYYAWGETHFKKDYSWETYQLSNYSKHNVLKYCSSYDFGLVDNLMELLPEDDAAYQYQMNHEWRIPTKEQCRELLKYTKNTCVDDYDNVQGLKGLLFTSLTNGNQIFIPTSGFTFAYNTYGSNSTIKLWTSSLNANHNNTAWCIENNNIYTSRICVNTNVRSYGLNIRPVTTK